MISVIIPTYNERDNIVPLVKKIEETLSGHTGRYEVIIVDDDSPDGTANALKKAYGRDRSISVHVRRSGRDLGTAILYGIGKSKGDVIVGMDADFNHPPEKIPELTAMLKKYDLAVASRFIRGGGMDDKKRQYLTFFFNLFLKHLLGFPIMDNMSGFYAVKRNKLHGLPLEAIYKGYGEYHLRLVHYCQESRFRIGEVPVYYREREFGKSKSNLFRMFVTYLWTAFRLKLGKL